MLILLWLVAVLVGAVALAYVNASGVVWSAAIAGALAVLWGAHLVPDVARARARRRLRAASRFRSTSRRCGAGS